MFGISQCGENIHYVKWVPSESGPLVTYFNSIHVNGGINFKDTNSVNQIFEPLKEITKSTPTPVSISIDITHVNLFQIRSDDSSQESLINWHFAQTSEENLSEKFESFQFPMHTDSKSVLGLTLPSNFKKNILEIASKNNCKLNGLSCGIFSAEQGARQWYHTNQLSSYVIWKIGKRNIDHLLYIKDGKLLTFLSIRKIDKKIKPIQVIGCHNGANLLVDQLNDIIKSNKSKFTCAEKVFVYQCDKRQKETRELMNLVIENLILLNPFSVLEMEVDKKINEFSSLSFAETGVAFRGIDV